jgi:hypothetical protein
VKIDLAEEGLKMSVAMTIYSVRILGVLTLGASLVAGCAAKDDAMNEQEFCEEYARRECTEVGVGCGFNTTEKAECLPIRMTTCMAFAARSKSAARQFRPSNTDACLNQVTLTYKKVPITRADFDMLEDVCSRAYQGTAMANEACTIDYECTGSLICDKGRCGTRELVAAGSGCANVGEICPKAEFCSNSSGLYLCVQRQNKGAVCDAARPCFEQYFCTGTCVDRLPLGAGCLADEDCSSRYCSPSSRCGDGLRFAEDAPSCVPYKRATSSDAGVDSSTNVD